MSTSHLPNGVESTGVNHYENFPVASFLCPKAIRPAVQAIYYWARTGDDLADEGEVAAGDRLAALSSMRLALQRAIDQQPLTAGAATYRPLVMPLAQLVAAGLSPKPLFDLLLAFEADVHHTVQAPLGERYKDLPALLDYCAQSANPIGRLMLQLYKVNDTHTVAQSDAVCTALQLINFWQDLTQDLSRGRFYIPASVLAQHQLPPLTDVRHISPDQAAAVVGALVVHARGLMHQGVGIVHRVPGRAGWELAVVVTAGLRLLQRIENTGFQSARIRVKLNKWDALVVAYQAVRLKLLGKMTL